MTIVGTLVNDVLPALPSMRESTGIFLVECRGGSRHFNPQPCRSPLAITTNKGLYRLPPVRGNEQIADGRSLGEYDSRILGIQPISHTYFLSER